MNNNVVYWIKIPQSAMEKTPWDTISLLPLLEDLELAQRRTTKDVGVASERSRHTVVCAAIERGCHAMEHVIKSVQYARTPRVAVVEYARLIELMMQIYKKSSVNCFVGTSFLHADRVELQRSLFQRLKREHGDRVKEKGLEIILNKRLQYLYDTARKKMHSFDYPITLRSSTDMNVDLNCVVSDSGEFQFGVSEQNMAEQVLSDDVREIDQSQDERITNNRGGKLNRAQKRVDDFLVTHLSDDQSYIGVNLADESNVVITQLLHSLVYRESSERRGNTSRFRHKELPIVYSDGSQASPFPINCIWEKSIRSRKMEKMHIGMATNRHSDLDQIVSMYWFLNMEMSGRGQTAAEIDNFCYRRSVEMFQSIRESDQYLNIFFYQTGYPFAVIGFYRALTEFLIDEVGFLSKVCVTPMFFQGPGNSYKKGADWY